MWGGLQDHGRGANRVGNNQVEARERAGIFNRNPKLGITRLDRAVCRVARIYREIMPLRVQMRGKAQKHRAGTGDRELVVDEQDAHTVLRDPGQGGGQAFYLIGKALLALTMFFQDRFRRTRNEICVGHF